MFEKSDVLIFLEDPGAVNFLVKLPLQLSAHGLSSTVLATGYAVQQLQNRDVKAQSLMMEHRAADIVKEVSPGCIIVGTSDNKKSFAFDLVQESKRSSIPCIGAVDMAANAQRRFRGMTLEPLAHVPDFLFVPDNETMDAFLALGFPKGRIVKTGHPHSDYVLDKGRQLAELNKIDLKRKLFPALEPKKPVILFLTQPKSNLEKGLLERSADYTLLGWQDSNDRTEIVLQELLDCLRQTREDFYFGLRLHPKNNKIEFERYVEKLDFINDDGDSLELVWVCDMIIGMSTMLLYEAALLNKTVLSVLPRQCEKDWLPFGLASFISCAVTREELQNEFSNSFLEMSNGEKFSDRLNIQTGALERITKFLLELLKK